ncbi:MAG: ParB/RepB/Spo0J family partition protein [Clostridia bacterium]|nr:ParB/RepB/Spo0J family partition protein [Clostridia bacterium]
MKKSEKAVKEAAKKTDVIVSDNTDNLNNTTTDTTVETKTEPATQKSKSLIIKLEDLVPFKDHPYQVREGAELDDLTESVGIHGIMNPLLVRPLEGEDGKYEIISGHRRFFAAQKLGLKKVPCTVHFIDRDVATVMMVDSNCQRTELLPSEKVWAYKMKMEAMSRQGKRTDLEQTETCDSTSRPLGAKLRDNRTDEKLAENSADSARQISRYIRLTYLVPELLQYVDEGKIGMRPAVEMSYLDEEIQRCIVDRIDESDGTVFPSHAQTRRIREKAAEGEISYDDVKAIMDEQKPNQVEKVKIPTEELRSRIGKSMTDEAFIKYLYTAVDYYKKYLERQRDQGAR